MIAIFVKVWRYLKLRHHITRSLFSIDMVFGLRHAWLNHLSQLSHLLLEFGLLGNEYISDAARSFFTHVHLNICTDAPRFMCMFLSCQLPISVVRGVRLGALRPEAQWGAHGASMWVRRNHFNEACASRASCDSHICSSRNSDLITVIDLIVTVARK